MKIIDSAVILTLITAFLYCASTAYIHGYFDVLHLDSDVLDRNFHQILYHGMILNIWTFLTIPFLIAAIITVHSTFFIELSRYVNKNYSSGKEIVQLRKKLRLKRKQPTTIEIKHSKRIRMCWSVFLSLFTFMTSMIYFESKGQGAAQTMQKSVEEKKYSAVRLAPKKKNKQLALLYCGARNCAALNTINNEIVYFPQKGHSQFFYKEK